MAHQSQREYVERVKARWPHLFYNLRVIELGSRNINGTVRDLWDHCDYVGIDAVQGPGVDVVALAHEYMGEDIDVVVSCEMFEHDPHLAETISAVCRWLNVGGHLIATWAAPGRSTHGTRATGDVYSPDPDYYRSPTIDDVIGAAGGRLALRHAEIDGDAQDIYLFAVRV